METLFLKLFNMSITAGWLILAVILLRLLLHKAPKSMRCILWAMVGIRLLCPISFQSVLSLIPSSEPIPQDIVYSRAPAVYSGVPLLNQSINPIIADAFTPDPAASANPLQIYVFIASVIWIIGICIISCYALVSYMTLRRKVRESVRQEDHIWLCDHVPTPFILGIFHPRIILPSTISQQDLTYVLAHEHAHLKRHDHWWKLLAFMLLTVYWFHPLVWAAYRLFCQDLELSCDEKVITEMGAESKRPYADALVNCSDHPKIHTACPLAFCEISVAKRIKAVLRYKKPAAWIIAAAAVLCVTSGFCFLTNPAGIPLRNIDSSTSADSIRLASADHTYTITSRPAMEQVMQFLNKIQTARTAVTQTSDNDTDISDTPNRIVIFYQDESEEYYFNSSCTQVWTFDENGTSSIKRIYKPKTVLHFFNTQLDNLADQSSGDPDSSGTWIHYTYKNSPDFVEPGITLSMEDDTFSFSYSAFSSYLAFGTYKLTDQTLTLHTSDGQNTYVFDVKQDTFIFDASNSSPIPKYRYSGSSSKAESPVPDGAVFTSGSR